LRATPLFGRRQCCAVAGTSQEVIRMKHNTHIYVARKSIEFLYDALGNLHNRSGSKASSKRKTEARQRGKILQRLLYYHKDTISEASWTPDDVLRDMALYHIFKLFTDSEFTDCEGYIKETHTKNGKYYYRARGGGGLPYRVEHLARVIRDMSKLRDYNDSFSMQQIMYLFFLLSHYVVDAHVPMHCDIRDDKPSAAKPKEGNYYEESWHAKVEGQWEEACTPVGLEEELFDREQSKHSDVKTTLSKFVTFKHGNRNHRREIKTYYIAPDDLLKFMIDLCIKTKERSLKLFPPAAPNNVLFDDKFNKLTREIFASAIGNLISIWSCIWSQEKP
jgi:hypothetical protein